MTQKKQINSETLGLQNQQIQYVVTKPRKNLVVQIDYSAMTIQQILRATYLDVKVGLRDPFKTEEVISRMQAITNNKLALSYFYMWQHISIHHEITTARSQEPATWEPNLIPINQLATQVELTVSTLADLYQGEGTAANLNQLQRWYSFQLPIEPRKTSSTLEPVMSSPFLIAHVYELMTTNPSLLHDQRETLLGMLTRQ